MEKTEQAKMVQTKSLSAEDIATAPIAPAPALDAVCQNDDPRDRSYSYYDADPTNTQW